MDLSPFVARPGEWANPGDTNPYYEVSVIYLETIRDEAASAGAGIGPVFTSTLYAAVAHELGHGPKGQPEESDHGERSLVGLGAHSISELFATGTIRRFRETSRWWK
jgi:hypothetical protein